MSKVVIYKGKNIIERTEKALETLDPKLPKEGSVILIKPNLVEPLLKTSGAVTRPEVIKGIIDYFSRNRTYSFLIGESSSGNNTTHCFEVAGYFDTFENNKVRIINFDEHRYVKTTINNELWKEVYITEYLFKANYVISAAVLKEHPFGVTLSIKNMMGLLKPLKDFPNKRYIHEEGIEGADKWASRLCDILSVRKPDLGVIDGTTAMYGSHVRGKTTSMDLTCVGEDLVFLDKTCADIVGHADTFYIGLANKRGLGELEGDVIKHGV